MASFIYRGVEFAPYRNFTENEKNLLWSFTKGQLALGIQDFNYEQFYTCAEKANAVVDIYSVKGSFAYPVSSGMMQISPEDVPEHYIRYRSVDLKGTEATMPEQTAEGLISAMGDETPDDFFPTPEAVGNLMFEQEVKRVDSKLSGEIQVYAWAPLRETFRGYSLSILEPSAGRGDLVKIIENHVGRNAKIDCIEKNPDLRAILTGKGKTVVHDDFLTFQTGYLYDAIIMNPPFSNGEDHLRKAMKLQTRNGGIVIALLNAETIRNPYTKKRKELLDELNSLDAEVVFVKNGFLHAPRPTDVEVAIVKVQMPAPKVMESDLFERLTREVKSEMEQEPEPPSQALVSSSFVERMVQNYNVEVRAGLEMYRIYNELKPHILDSLDDGQEHTSPKAAMLSLTPARENDYIEMVRMKYWSAAVRNPEIYGQLTASLKDQWDAKVKTLCRYDFTVFNLESVLREMLHQVAGGVEEAILHYFDQFTRYALYDGTSNVHYYNGWRSNSCYKINKKIIMPCYSVVRTDPFWAKSLGLMDLHEAYRILSDIEKVFGYLDDGTTKPVDLTTQLNLANQLNNTKNIDTKFFTVTFYKKGTMHIKFKDDRLLDAFNIFGARKHGWLPPSYGKKAYADMSEEEQTVINEFQGEEAYREVLKNTKFYLQDPGMKKLSLPNACA